MHASYDERQRRRPARPEEQGQALVEYALLLVLMGVFLVLTLQIAGVSMEAAFCAMVENFGATSSSCPGVGDVVADGNDGQQDDDESDPPGDPDDGEEEEEEGEEEREQFLFTDDFSQAGLSKWNHTSDWERDDGRVCSERSRDFVFMTAPNSRGSDYDVSMDIELESGQGFTIFFRASGAPGDAYSLSYENRGGRVFTLHRWNNGYPVWPPVAQAGAPEGFQMNNIERRLSLTVAGDTFAAYFDGTPILSGSDDNFGLGAVGMSPMRNSKVCFDDVRVSGWR